MNLDEYRNQITLQLTRISGDIEHIKEKVTENNKHLEKINGRLRTAENNITKLTSVGTTVTVIITIAISLVGLLK
tara:strand:- start:1326 stop:1550 length:225 start_codon:yes stop_codon:yes gene_type:complete